MRHRRQSASVLTLLAVLCTVQPALAQPSVMLPAADRMLTAPPAALYTVGRLEGESWEMFALVTAVDFDADDNLYVLDAQNHRVVVFDRTGRFVREFGRRGGGPGEFRTPTTMIVTADGAILVADPGQRAFLRFTKDGRPDDSTPFAEGQIMPMIAMRAAPGGGMVVAMPEALDMAKLEAQAQSGGRIEMNPATHIVADPLTSGSTPTRLFVQPAATSTRPLDTGTGIRMSMPVTVHFAPALHWDVLPDGGIAVVNTAEYTIRLLSPTGTVTRVLARPLEPRRVTRRDEAAVREALERGLGANSEVLARLPPEAAAMMDNVRRQQLENMQFAPVMPVLSALRVDRAGRLWLARTPADREAGQMRIDLVTADGRYIGTMIDEALPMAFSRSGRVAYVQVDDMGVQRVTVKQVPADWR